MADTQQETLAYLLAKERIREVLGQYAEGLFERDWSKVRACFHEDAHIDYGPLCCGSVDDMVEALDSATASLQPELLSIANITMQIAEGNASSKTYGMSWHTPLDGTDPTRIGVWTPMYSDRWVCTVSGDWLIAQRDVSFSWMGSMRAESVTQYK